MILFPSFCYCAVKYELQLFFIPPVIQTRVIDPSFYPSKQCGDIAGGRVERKKPGIAHTDEAVFAVLAHCVDLEAVSVMIRVEFRRRVAVSERPEFRDSAPV